MKSDVSTYASTELKGEDALTAELAEALREPKILESFWRIAAPVRFRNEKPRFKNFKLLRPVDQVGPTKPDLLFRAHNDGHPLLYLEAKLECGTEPLQLTRARSWMRASGARDDQVLLLTQYSDRLPDSIGWKGPSLPVTTMTWHELDEYLHAECAHYSSSAKTALWKFSAKLNRYRRKGRCKTKRSLVFESQHCFGKIMSHLATRWSKG